MIEKEVKFLVRDLASLAGRLVSLGAALEQPEVHEVNLRFDRPDGSLTASYQVLRLRRDARARLTYKGQGIQLGDVSARHEIEFEVSDFDAAQALLEALGYEVSMVYEKYRTTYQLGSVEVVLDRTPIGDFAELEGPGAEDIKAAARQLQLDWGASSVLSYAGLFARANESLGRHVRDLTFENFAGLEIRAEVLGMRYADRT